jgi:hypothetical protein
MSVNKEQKPHMRARPQPTPRLQLGESPSREPRHTMSGLTEPHKSALLDMCSNLLHSHRTPSSQNWQSINCPDTFFWLKESLGQPKFRVSGDLTRPQIPGGMVHHGPSLDTSNCKSKINSLRPRSLWTLCLAAKFLEGKRYYYHGSFMDLPCDL